MKFFCLLHFVDLLRIYKLKGNTLKQTKTDSKTEAIFSEILIGQNFDWNNDFKILFESKHSFNLAGIK